MSVTKILLGAAGGESKYFYQTLGLSGAGAGGNKVKIAASGNIYVAGISDEGNSDYQFNVLVTKFSPSGALLWQYEYAVATPHICNGLAIDSSENLYVACIATYSSPNGIYQTLLKLDYSGNLLWQKRLPDNSKSNSVSSSIDVSIDGSQNPYLLIRYNDSNMRVIKLNSSGVIQWQRQISSPTGQFYTESIDIELATSSIYAVGGVRINTSDTYFYPFIAKWNSSGTYQWQRMLKQPISDPDGSATGITIWYSTQEIYMVGRNWSTGSFIAKYNASGTLQWQRKLATPGGSAWNSAVYDNGYIYVVSNTGYIYKYDSSGTLQWQRSVNISPRNIYIKDSTMYICGYSSGYLPDSKLVLITLPTDGTLTGTYGSFTYAVSTRTESAGDYTAATSALSTSTPTDTVSTASFVKGDSPLVLSKTSIG